MPRSEAGAVPATGPSRRVLKVGDRIRLTRTIDEAYPPLKRGTIKIVREVSAYEGTIQVRGSGDEWTIQYAQPCPLEIVTEHATENEVKEPLDTGSAIVLFEGKEVEVRRLKRLSKFLRRVLP